MYQMFSTNLLCTEKKGWVLQKFLLVSALEAAQIILKELLPKRPATLVLETNYSLRGNILEVSHSL